MTPSVGCLELVKRFEPCWLVGRLDPSSTPTIGYRHFSPSLRVGDEITPAQAEAFLFHDLLLVGRELAEVLDVDLTQPQFDAVVAFIFDTGMGRFHRSLLLTRINSGEMGSAGKEFTRWSSPRRRAEQELFNKEETRKDGV